MSLWSTFVQNSQLFRSHLVFLRSGLLWILWRQQNDLVFDNVQWPIEKTRQIIWDALQDYGMIEWKRTLRDLEKALDAAYDDMLNEFQLIWRVKNLIVTRSNLVVTWMDRLQMSIVSSFPLRLRWFARVGCILGSFVQLNFQFVKKIKIKIAWSSNVQMWTQSG